MKNARFFIPVMLVCTLCMQGCAVRLAGKAVGAAGSAAVTAVKIPVRIGGAAIGAAIPDGDQDETAEDGT